MMQKTPPIVLNLIIINVLVYLAQIIITPFNVTEWGALHYFKSTLFMPHQFVTSIFMHDKGGFSHLLFNMFALWMFGSMLENYLGSKWFLFFYLICGLGAGLLVQLTVPFSAGLFAKSAEGLSIAASNHLSIAQMADVYKQQYSAIGASGAIMGIMAAFAYLFPNTKMYIMFIPVPIAAKYIIPFYILIDLFGGFQQIKGDNVGHFAHLGGALIGFLIILYWNKTNRKTFY
jgi:membrane associated rhomboid family serine protease